MQILLDSQEQHYFKCPMCKCLFADELSLKEHEKTHTFAIKQSKKPKKSAESSLNSQQQLSLKCKFCNSFFSDEPNLNDHEKTHIVYKCELCDFYGLLPEINHHYESENHKQKQAASLAVAKNIMDMFKKNKPSDQPDGQRSAKRTKSDNESGPAPAAAAAANLPKKSLKDEEKKDK